MLTKKTNNNLVTLAVYVDGIILSGNDDTSIHASKTSLQ